MKRGFTLIEILVVVTIIGILMGLALTSFFGSRKAARDGKRKADLGQYRVALEAYASNNKGNYPRGDCYFGSECGYGESDSNSGIFQNPGPLIPNYLPTKIPDPLEVADSTYHYRAENPPAPKNYYLVAHRDRWVLDSLLKW